jgi:hypothetical protein
MNHLYYLPLEPYAERYTGLMSCENGWAEDHIKTAKIPFTRIEGVPTSTIIRSGVVLDAIGRNQYALSQIQKLLDIIDKGEFIEGSFVYVEDFWHPGIEALFYVRDMLKLNFGVACFIHAQTFDEYDFCVSMRHWMRPMELGLAEGYDQIYTCSSILHKRLVEGGFPANKVYTVGLPYNSHRLLKQLYDLGYFPQGKNNNLVVFSSRLDKEKDPWFFFKVIEAMPDVKFAIANPRAGRPISNDPDVVKHLNRKPYANLVIVDTSKKKDYYELLANAKVQFNCALQDWVSWTLLEAITFECFPVYPIWRDFPYELEEVPESLYEKGNVGEAVERIRHGLDSRFPYALDKRVHYHNATWPTFIKLMNLQSDRYEQNNKNYR